MTAADVDAAFGVVLDALGALRAALVATLAAHDDEPGPHRHAPSGYGVWAFQGSQPVGGGEVCVTVVPGSSAGRVVSLSTTDSFGNGWPLLDLLQPGSTITVTDDPDSLPITNFSVYLVREPGRVHDGWVSYLTERIVRAGASISASPDGTPLRVYSSLVGAVEPA